MSEPRRPSRYVEPDIAEARIERQWSAIASRLEVRRPVGWRLPLGAAAVAAVVVLAVVLAWPRRYAPSPFERARLESGSGPVSVALVDGSRIELEPASRLRLLEGRASEVRLELERGGARFDVAHVAGRRFEVTAGGLEVEVVGTRFGVRVGKDDGVEVWVDRGAVEVSRRDRDEPGRRLAAGESLTVAAKTLRARAAGPSPATDTPPSATLAPPEPRPESAPDAGGSPRLAVPRPAPVPPAEPDAAAPSEPVAPTLATATAAQLLEMANAARRAGRVRDAAEAYDTLRRRFPGDPRSGLSAFELGRLRMDTFHDLPGAVEALGAAVRSSPGAGFREDAMARLVQAYDVMGAADACARARERYLASYPGGAQAAAVRARCGAP